VEGLSGSSSADKGGQFFVRTSFTKNPYDLKAIQRFCVCVCDSMELRLKHTMRLILYVGLAAYREPGWVRFNTIDIQITVIFIKSYAIATSC